MQFVLVALDRPNAVVDRLRIRPDHLKHLDSLGDSLLLAEWDEDHIAFYRGKPVPRKEVDTAFHL